MEASTLKSKKGAISKGKIKKNIKNVLCRPDPILWPEVTEEEGKRLELALVKHKVDIPEFKKQHWNELKLIPQDQRPKPPKLKKVDGLLFGRTECNNALLSGHCSAIIIDATVNPRMIAQPIIATCTEKSIPLVCLNDLRRICSTNFGISTSCLGVQLDSLLDLKDVMVEIAKSHQKPTRKINAVEKINVIEDKCHMDIAVKNEANSTCRYLYRTSKKNRVFVPTAQENSSKSTRKFIGQDFIEFSNKQESKDSKEYMKMMLKRISNNADRVKKK